MRSFFGVIKFRQRYGLRGSGGLADTERREAEANAEQEGQSTSEQPYKEQPSAILRFVAPTAPSSTSFPDYPSTKETGSSRNLPSDQKADDSSLKHANQQGNPPDSISLSVLFCLMPGQGPVQSNRLKESSGNCNKLKSTPKPENAFHLLSPIVSFLPSLFPTGMALTCQSPGRVVSLLETSSISGGNRNDQHVFKGNQDERIL
jgi:hypothetical protein